MNLNDYSKENHDIAKSKGWWENERNFPEQLCLMHSELSEILEEYRKGKNMTEIIFMPNEEGNSKPEGIPIEFADLLIRVFDTCGKYNINLEKAIEIKMEYNKKRPYRHGNKKA